MRIGIDARGAVSVTDGIGRYAVELLRAFSERNDAHEYVVLKNPRTRFSFRFDARFREVSLEVERFSLHEQVVLPRMLGGLRLDLFHSLHMAVPLRYRGAMVMTIHDIFPMLLPWSFGRGELRNRISSAYLAYLIRQGVRRTSMVMVDSDCTGRDLCAHAEVPESRLRRIYLGADHVRVPGVNDASEVRTQRVPEGRFLLTVTNFRPHKNTGRLLEAFALAREAVPDLRLVVAGDDPKQRAASLGTSGDLLKSGIELAGFVDEDSLMSLFRSAEAFVYPSLYEGFGFPVLEAMASGTPVITSGATSIPELGGDAVLYVNPGDTREIADAIVRVCSNADLRRDLGLKGIRQSAKFTWQRTAEETLQVYEEVMHRQSAPQP